MGYKEEDDRSRFHKAQGLAEIASKARGDLTQSEVADKLGVTKQSVSKAEDAATGSRMNSLRIQIIEEIGGHTVDGPYWVVEFEGDRKEGDRSSTGTAESK
jgi:transcriptional regulator with XRE-family HTH domain